MISYPLTFRVGSSALAASQLTSASKRSLWHSEGCEIVGGDIYNSVHDVIYSLFKLYKLSPRAGVIMVSSLWLELQVEVEDGHGDVERRASNTWWRGNILGWANLEERSN